MFTTLYNHNSDDDDDDNTMPHINMGTLEPIKMKPLINKEHNMCPLGLPFVS